MAIKYMVHISRDICEMARKKHTQPKKRTREREIDSEREILASLNVKPIKSKWGAKNPMWHSINQILLQIHDSSDKRHRLH